MPLLDSTDESPWSWKDFEQAAIQTEVECWEDPSVADRQIEVAQVGSLELLQMVPGAIRVDHPAVVEEGDLS